MLEMKGRSGGKGSQGLVGGFGGDGGAPGRVRVAEGGVRVGPRVTHRRRRSPRLPVGQGSGFCGLPPPAPLRTPPPAAGRAAAQAHRAPVGPQRPDRRGFTPRPRRKRRPAFHLPPPAAASGCPRGARAEPCLTHARPVPLAWYPRPSPCAGAAILAGVGSARAGALGPSGVPAFWTFRPPSSTTMQMFFSPGEKGGRRRWRDALCFHDNCVGGVRGAGVVRKPGCRLLIVAPARGATRGV